MKKLIVTTGIILIISNMVFFVPMTFSVLRSGGGGFGYGLLLLPITIVAHLYIIPGVISLFKKYQTSIGLLLINISGLIGSVFWIWFFSSN
ncbi:hypothetical protein [Ekhidna sp.]